MTHRPHDQQQQPRDLYTIPISARWFNWDSIHDTERRSLPEFFDSSSYSRSPRVYKEYRDFIINKFREDPNRRLTFTDVRRSLIGDVGSVEKVFSFLDRWGLINFGVAKGEEDKEKGMVVVEEGPPAGMKVVMASAIGKGGGGGEGVIRLPALSSYRDVFGEEGKGKKGTVCGVCGEQCGSDRVDSGKVNFDSFDVL